MTIPSATGLHFLLLPYTEHGHITPMLSLASQLASLQCKITFLRPPKRYTERSDSRDGDGLPRHIHATQDSSSSQLQVIPPTLDELDPHPSGSDLLHFVTVPDHAPTYKPVTSSNINSAPPMSSLHLHLKNTLAQQEQRQAVVELLVQESKASAHPITCVVCDLFMWKWVEKIASRQGLHFTILVTSSALALYTGYLKDTGRDAELEKLLVSGFGLPGDGDARRYGLINVREAPEMRKQKMKFPFRLQEGIQNANADILVNSFKRLEAPLLPALESSGLKVRFIGPCIPSWDDSVSCNVGSKMAKQAGTAFVEEDACLPWLDRQEDRSVLFVSFGSEGVLEKEQVEEIAMGVEMSGFKFLWVMRPDAPATSWPSEEFRNRHSRRIDGAAGDSDQYDLQRSGMFVSWVPQRRVLQHRAVGGFLTHSGWNSTIESVTFGVPMLCLPLVGDQPLNGNLVEIHWRVGLRLKTSCHKQGGIPSRNTVAVVDRKEVERGVRAVMEGWFSEQVSELQQAAHMAATEDGPNSLASFVHDVRKSHQPTPNFL